jgi:long-chain acyl-CoA synthetase
MDKFWLKSYEAGVPAEIDWTQYRSLTHLLEDSFRKYANRNAFACMGKSMTFAELDKLSGAMAAWLQHKGLAPGARVAIMLPNVLQYPVAMVAILRAGYTIVNVNPLYTARELKHQLNDSGAEAIIVLENFAHTVADVVPGTKVKHVIVGSMGDLLGAKGLLVNFVVRTVKKMVPAWSLPSAVPFKRVLAEGARLARKPVECGHEDVAFLQYTGGTTGVSKGAVLKHKNVIANVLQNEAWFGPTLAKIPPDEALQFVCALPLYHIYALTVCALLGLRVGGTNLLIPNPRDIPGFVKELHGKRIHIFPAVNTLYNALLNDAGFRQLDLSHLRLCPGGGMAVQKTVADKWQALTGVPIVEGYGMSETSPVVAVNRCDTKEFSGTIGIALPSTELRILDDAGSEVPFGERGEIAVRGPQVMAGYWNRPDETAKVMTPDGFFKTGDIGIMDQRGYVKIVDRKKDMILVSGFNVYPNEVEEVVMAHPGVLEVACVGVPDEHSGEAVKLYVVKKDAKLDKSALMDWCREQLTGYKRPKYVEFRDTLPKTNVGKILRRELREESPAS